MKAKDLVIRTTTGTLYIALDDRTVHPVLTKNNDPYAFDKFYIYNVTLSPTVWRLTPTSADMAKFNLLLLPTWSLQIGTPLGPMTHPNNQPAAPTKAPPLPQGQATAQLPTYRLGTLFRGLTSNNIWIINKDSSRDISLVWDGKGRFFKADDKSHRDNLKANTKLSQSNLVEAETVTNAKFGQFPQWVQALMWAKATGMVPNPAVKAVQSQMNPATVRVINAALRDSKITKDEPKKALYTDLKSCDHEFREYIGFREVYSYCIHCDIKLKVKQ